MGLNQGTDALTTSSPAPERLHVTDYRQLQALCGPHDRHLVTIENALGVTLARRGGEIAVFGTSAPMAAEVLRSLLQRLTDGKQVESGDVEAALRFAKAEENQLELFRGGRLEIRTRRRIVEPRSAGQQLYVEALFRHEMTFGIGPAGTGKTYLAVAAAVQLFLEGKVDRIILSRPAVEAGERLGFLPGDMKDKIDPYLRPLYDALNDLWPGAKVPKLIEEGRVEVAPLAFMRGRTLANAFVVLDEAQNTTEAQMKMFLTRLGEGSRMVITGDPTQVDLPRGVPSGLDQAVRVLHDVEGIAICKLDETDVVRHPLVGRIVRAYAERG